MGIISAYVKGIYAERKEAMSDWQPIETAPKEKAVLVFEEGQKGPMMGVMVLSILDERKYWESVFVYGYEWEDYISNPTHWMPLPKPPPPNCR